MSVDNALSALVVASRTNPTLRGWVQEIEDEIRRLRVARWDDADMYEAWAAGAQWVIDRVEVEDGELYVPVDDAGVLGRDWHEECGHWLCDYESELDGAE